MAALRSYALPRCIAIGQAIAPAITPSLGIVAGDALAMYLVAIFAAEGLRDETVGLFDIDEYATKAACRKIVDGDRALLDVVRTGASWGGRAGFWAGQKDTNMCKLCGLAKRDSDPHHMDVHRITRRKVPSR